MATALAATPAGLGIGLPNGFIPQEPRFSGLSPVDRARRCSISGANADWELFHASFHRLISQVVTRTARRWNASWSTETEDLVQETYLKLYRQRTRLLGGLEGRQPAEVFALVKVVATNLVHDHFKRTRCCKRGGQRKHDSLQSMEDGLPEIACGRWGPEAMEHRILLQQIQRCLERACESQSTARRDQTVFWLYYRQ
jgi:DNA-directed RNA polymerase specialized sigma24 family protein